MGSDFAGLLFLRGEELIEDMAVGSGVVIAIGDMVKTTGTVVLDAAAVTDDLAFIGVAKEAHYSTDPASRISVAIRNGQAIYGATLDAATTVAIGDLLQLFSGSCATKLKKIAAGTHAVAMAVKGGSSVTSAEVVLMLPNKTSGPRLVGAAS